MDKDLMCLGMFLDVGLLLGRSTTCAVLRLSLRVHTASDDLFSSGYRGVNVDMDR